MNKRILLVEDDAVARETLSRFVVSLGNQVMVARSAEEAKGLIKTVPPDVALLDIGLPGLSGESFGIYLRHKCPNTRIIFITGEPSLEEQERFGADAAFFRKPVDLQQLVEQLQ